MTPRGGWPDLSPTETPTPTKCYDRVSLGVRTFPRAGGEWTRRLTPLPKHSPRREELLDRDPNVMCRNSREVIRSNVPRHSRPGTGGG